MTFSEELQYYAQKTQKELDKVLPSQDCPQKEVIEAMRYSLLAGGKRLRAALLLDFCKVFGGDENSAMTFACAVEMVHAYSLIHDDLPCMDDDDIRRGKPSCHIAYGEATALLAGDGLLTYAFELMLNCKNLPADRVLKSAACLSKAIGFNGMIGGQVMDLANEGRSDITSEQLEATDLLKTGALIMAACEIGGILAGIDEEKLVFVRKYAQNIGIAFQITDDILDEVSNTEELGKPVGSDKLQEKITYVNLYGVEKAKEISANLIAEAKKNLKDLCIENEFLYKLADYILERRN